MASPAMVLDRLRGALWGIFIADALSMPVHWYYNPGDIRRDFGVIETYQAPKSRHPSSIMSVSNTGGHGRGGQSGRIVGDVINHGKHDFWGKSGVHYHQGMKAGENTLNAICARVVMRTIARDKGYDDKKWLEEYVKFMTTPGSHNDTYAESFHRDFFKNWAAGVPPERCSEGTEGHNTAQIGGFVMLPPVILAKLDGPAAAKERMMRHLTTTHESRKLAGYAEQYSDLIYSLVTGADLRTATQALATRMRVDLSQLVPYDDIRIVHSTFGSACYIEDSFPSLLYLSYKYADSFEKAVLANTNVGGENCHRGAALGAVMGAAAGESRIPKRLIEGLHDSKAIKAEIDAYVTALHPELLQQCSQQQQQQAQQ
ncbi:hypothetical protein HYH02_007904 [Chlamydomonas schloesseri]|uniref:ADP-ribosylglycohydrolase n=1 Tax=Chlamydomonas schloesseri TaxID=2026947 RepID=A0A836B4H3_9CHLO|nr:hypothetical protein HYH02_007904 [Chlamydomonas schloesseri]|eukprot:KAG2447158.1 hypothetical protein HYH02_007904 [Chlamydomonas schloesseri]